MRLVPCGRHGNPPPQRKVLGSRRKTERVGFLAISIKNLFDQWRCIKPVLIFIRRRAARRAESALMTVVQRGGNGCCSGRGRRRKFENEKYLPRYEIIRLVKAASRKATISSLRSRASAMVMFKRLSSCGTPIAVPISSRPPVK